MSCPQHPHWIHDRAGCPSCAATTEQTQRTPPDHAFTPNTAVPVSCAVCGEEQRFHEADSLRAALRAERDAALATVREAIAQIRVHVELCDDDMTLPLALGHLVEAYKGEQLMNEQNLTRAEKAEAKAEALLQTRGMGRWTQWTI